MERLTFLLGFEATDIPVAYLLERFSAAFLATFLAAFLATFLKTFGFLSLYEWFNESVGQITFSDHDSSFRQIRENCYQYRIDNDSGRDHSGFGRDCDNGIRKVLVFTRRDLIPDHKCRPSDGHHQDESDTPRQPLCGHAQGIFPDVLIHERDQAGHFQSRPKANAICRDGCREENSSPPRKLATLRPGVSLISRSGNPLR